MFLVGGTFDREGGKPSFFVGEIARLLGTSYINGGHIEDLNIDFSFTDILIWMPDIDNKEDKILPKIKSENPHMLLVQSKRITDGNYSESDIVGRLLKSRSLLGITIEKKKEGYEFKLLDPLGNIYCSTDNLPELCASLSRRVWALKGLTRMPSKKAGSKKEFDIDEDFLHIVKDFGNKFSEYVNAVNPNRLLGNASTRCESGFPVFKKGERIFVSRRNVDKRTLSSDEFVEVVFGDGAVEYFGNNKPSVDTPVQLLLFSFFRNIKYMIHGHVYVKDAVTTRNKIPCGFLEEIVDIMAVINDADVENFAINLRGHGCIIACKDLSYFDTIELEARPFPEN